jgi:glycerate 2-kinase
VQRIHLHPARSAGVNEPTPEGVAGALEILRLVESLGPDDLCLCLISGGGSALMPAPVEGITLADKLAVTRHLSAAGANIEQLNAVRKQLSRIKGGGLLRACRAGRLVSLIMSDVLGDPFDVIASGPTVSDTSTPQAALEVLDRFGLREAGIAPKVFEYLERTIDRVFGGADILVCRDKRGPFGRQECLPHHEGESTSASDRLGWEALATGYCSATNIILANNATAVTAASDEAKRLGYAVAAEIAARSEGPAEQLGVDLAERALAVRAGVGVAVELPPRHASPTCFISGGEPVVKLVEAARRGMGGRNQQLVLAALLRLLDDGADGIVLLSGGTDGEDGPTDAAGALLDADVLAAARELNLDPADYLARNDAYNFFSPLNALIKTGPTQTNVCDVRVVITAAKPQA